MMRGEQKGREWTITHIYEFTFRHLADISWKKNGKILKRGMNDQTMIIALLSSCSVFLSRAFSQIGQAPYASDTLYRQSHAIFRQNNLHPLIFGLLNALAVGPIMAR